MRFALVLALSLAGVGWAWAGQQSVNVGISPNDGQGDTPRVAFQKLNANDGELYSGLAALQAALSGGTVLLKSNNLSDLPSLAAARTNLGLGGAAILNVGTGPGTVAAGDDSRILGALQTVNALSEINVAGTIAQTAARTNLGLGTLATQNANSVVITGGAISGTSLTGSLTGNASTASALATVRTLSLTGDAAGSLTFDGSANVSGALTLASTGVAANSYGTSTSVPTVTVDAKGRVTGVALTPIAFPVTTVAGRTGAVTLAVGDVSGAAPLASPALTGTPTVPTATAGTNTTQAASTAFTTAAVATETSRATSAEQTNASNIAANGTAISNETSRAQGVEATLVPKTRQIIPGTGLTGGGDLSADRSLAIATAGVTNALLATAPAGTLKGNPTGSTAAVTDNALTAYLDAAFGSTQGGILYRGASVWSFLSAGTTGQVLQTGGSSANLSWATLPTAATVPPVGQVRLAYSSSTALTLCPRGGNQIYVGGANRTLSSCQTLSNTGLTAGTLYYVYEYWTGSALAYEFSTTGHATDSATGIEFKSGDSSRTLVGAVYMASGTPGTFADSPAQRFVASWFSRPPRPLAGTRSGSSTASSSPVILSTGQRVAWVNWADETLDLRVRGNVYGSAVGVYMDTYVYVDGAKVGEQTQSMSASNGSGSITIGPAIADAAVSAAEGYHYADAYGDASGGTGNWNTNIVGGVLQ